MRSFDKLPESFRTDEVKKYYDVLKRKVLYRAVKRLCDVFFSAVLLCALFPLFLVIAVIIKLDSCGPVFFRQERVTRYGETFRIFKFRTMIADCDDSGECLAALSDSRVTKFGAFLRKYRLDELAQLLDVFRGKMSFIGTRPEITEFYCAYSSEMLATLLMPAGITSRAAVVFKDEAKLLDGESDVKRSYIEKILPAKMQINLQSLMNIGFKEDLITVVMTIAAFFGRDYEVETI